jgi:hypothetical protein
MPAPRSRYDLRWRRDPEWDVDPRDYLMTEPLRVSNDGHIVPSDSPGMGYDLATDRLASTRIT